MAQEVLTEIILIRHGETPWTEIGRFQGHSDISLSAFGEKQAKVLAKAIKYKIKKIDVLYTSCLKRTKQTGRPLAKMLSVKPVSDKRINEYFFGRWEGKTALDLAREKEPAYLTWRKGRWADPPGGERLINFKKRVRGFLKMLMRKHKGKKIVLVSHGGPIKMMMLIALKLPFRSFGTFRIDTASVSALTLRGNRPQLTLLNDRSHLKGLLKDSTF